MALSTNSLILRQTMIKVKKYQQRQGLIQKAKAMIRLACLFFLAGCTSLELFAINSLARFDDYRVVAGIAYGDWPLNHLDLYLPQQQKAIRATVIFFYGGCWGGCSTINKAYYRFVAQALTAHGYAVAIADYRRYPEVRYAGIMHDTVQAVTWVKMHIAGYGADPDKLFLMGHSAGAHLGAMLTLNEAYLPPEIYRSIKGFIGLAGPYDFLPFTDAYQHEVFGPEENYPASQPVNFVQGSEPPLLLLYGNDDATVKPVNIESLSRKVRQAGGCVETHFYDNLDHVALLAALSIPLKTRQPVLPDIVHFLDHYSQQGRQCRA